jgi:hypothetical protein
MISGKMAVAIRRQKRRGRQGESRHCGGENADLQRARARSSTARSFDFRTRSA